MILKVEMMHPANRGELPLVLRAISLRLNGCCNWNRSARDRFVKDPEIRGLGLTPEGIANLLADHVDEQQPIAQKKQDDEWDADCEFWYGVRLEIAGYHKRLFVKLVLRDNDPEFPVVEIVSCHF